MKSTAAACKRAFQMGTPGTDEEPLISLGSLYEADSQANSY